MLIVDAHQDLAWNMLTFGRDYTRSALETRRLEMHSAAPRHNGDTLLGWHEYQQGRVAVIFATLFASPARRTLGEWDVQSYRDTAEARLRYSAQLDAYHRLVDQHPDKFRLIRTQTDLRAHLAEWQPETASPPVGLVILMEAAEAVGHPSELEEWWQRGVRLIGPAWAGTRFCGGTGEPGPLTSDGYALLEAMADFGFSLDFSHMDEKAVLQALDIFPGTMLASHANASALLDGLDSNRFLSDRVIHGLIERDAIIGVVPYNPFLLPGWQASDGRHRVTLGFVAAQIDYICQLAGDAAHVGIGSDFDGGFGLQSVPEGIDTIADLGKLAGLLAEKGYTESDIQSVMGQNWLNLLARSLP
ncbi:MAG: peptidase M19 [Chloroflexi bacterium]|jgi:membrane dipeptidase|nr:peptidase M19 [Chloroflexota bacterium]